MNRPCPQWQDQIADDVLETLDPPQAGALREHLAGCEACRQYAQSLQEQTKALVALGREIEAGMEARRERAIEALQAAVPAGTATRRAFPFIDGFLRGFVRTGGSLKASGLGDGGTPMPGKPSFSGQAIPKLRLRLPPRGHGLFTPLLRTAVAATLILAAGVGLGRWTAPHPVDVAQLRADLQASIVASLTPAVRESLLAEMEQRVQAGLATSEENLRLELTDQLRGDLQLFAAQFTAGSERYLQKRFTELVELIEEARLKDRQYVAKALDEIEQNRVQDKAQIGRGLQSLAALTAKATPAVQH